MGLILVSMKELSWVLHLAPLKNIMMASLPLHLMGSHYDDNTELQCDRQMELRMELNLGILKEPI